MSFFRFGLASACAVAMAGMFAVDAKAQIFEEEQFEIVIGNQPMSEPVTFDLFDDMGGTRTLVGVRFHLDTFLITTFSLSVPDGESYDFDLSASYTADIQVPGGTTTDLQQLGTFNDQRLGVVGLGDPVDLVDDETFSAGLVTFDVAPGDVGLYVGSGTFDITYNATGSASATTTGIGGSGTASNPELQGRIRVFFDYETTSTPIPEPATWAMMLLGFGLAGVRLRGRRTA